MKAAERWAAAREALRLLAVERDVVLSERCDLAPLAARIEQLAGVEERISACQREIETNRAAEADLQKELGDIPAGGGAEPCKQAPTLWRLRLRSLLHQKRGRLIDNDIDAASVEQQRLGRERRGLALVAAEAPALAEARALHQEITLRSDAAGLVVAGPSRPSRGACAAPRAAFSTSPR